MCNIVAYILLINRLSVYQSYISKFEYQRIKRNFIPLVCVKEKILFSEIMNFLYQ